MKPKRIELIRGANEWMARMVGDADLVRLFGTDTWPTPFPPTMAAGDVLERIQELNPEQRDQEQTRERWLERLRDVLAAELFAPLGLDVPDDVGVTCGWPSKRALSASRRAIGECWGREHSDRDRYEVLVSPLLDDVPSVAATMVHELAHAVAGVKAGHKGRFVKVIRAVGLTGKPTATVAGDELAARLEAWAERLGPYPHGRLHGLERPKRQAARMLKIECPDCSYTARAARRWIDVGLPTCPCGARFELAEPAGDDGELKSAGGASVMHARGTV